jgi:hypothetical protein
MERFLSQLIGLFIIYHGDLIFAFKIFSAASLEDIILVSLLLWLITRGSDVVYNMCNTGSTGDRTGYSDYIL